jgi:ribosomal protein S26
MYKVNTFHRWREFVMTCNSKDFKPRGPIYDRVPICLISGYHIHYCIDCVSYIAVMGLRSKTHVYLPWQVLALIVMMQNDIFICTL